MGGNQAIAERMERLWNAYVSVLNISSFEVGGRSPVPGSSAWCFAGCFFVCVLLALQTLLGAKRSAKRTLNHQNRNGKDHIWNLNTS